MSPNLGLPLILLKISSCLFIVLCTGVVFHMQNFNRSGPTVTKLLKIYCFLFYMTVRLCHGQFIIFLLLFSKSRIPVHRIIAGKETRQIFFTFLYLICIAIYAFTPKDIIIINKSQIKM